MEAEIQQTILTNNKIGIVHLMELLDAWANDPRIKQVNLEKLINTAEKYNEDAYKTYIDKLEEKVKEFTSTEHYKTLNNLDKYDLYFTGESSLLFYTNRNDAKKIVYGQEVYHKFYYNYMDSDQIDMDAMKTLYVAYITPMIDNFRSIAERYVARFLKGYIDLPSHNYSQTFAAIETVEKQQNTQKLIEFPENRNTNKIQFNLTVNQLAVLFKLLREAKIISANSDAEIQRFIIDNIITPGTNPSAISKSNLANAFSKKDGKSASDIIKLLRKMIEEAGNL